MKTKFIVFIILGIVIGGLVLYGSLSNYIQNYNYKISKSEYLANQPTINVTGIIQHWQPIDGPSYSIIPEEDIDVEMNEYRGIFLYGKLSPSLEGKRVTVNGILIENYEDFQLKTLGGGYGGDPNTAVILVNQVFSFEPESQSTIQIKAKQFGIDNIMEAIDSEELSYDEKREYIKYNYEKDGPVTTPSLNMRIKDLPKNLEYGQLPTFTLIETGYANPCTSPKLEVYFIKEEIGHDLENDDLIFEHRIVMKCPYFDKFYPVLHYWSEKDFHSFPACIHEGRYLIVGDSGTERVALDEYYCNPK